MNVTPDAVSRRLRSGLAPALESDDRLRTFALDLGREITDYGISVLPRELFRFRSGAEVAGLVAEDLEAALWLKPMLIPREITRPAPAPEPSQESTEADVPEPQEPVIDKIPPRVVEFGRGWGVTAFVLALLDPDNPYELVEPSRARTWWWRRICSLYDVKNLRVHLMDHDEFVTGNVKQADVAITKRISPYDALEMTLPLLREGGRVISFQREDRAAEVRKPRTTSDGLPVRLESTLDLVSPVVRGRQVLNVRVGTLDAEKQSAA